MTAWGWSNKRAPIEALHGRFILPALLGSIDVRGGVLIRPPHPRFISEYEIELNELLSLKQKRKFIPQGRFELGGIETFDMIMENVVKVHGKAFSRCHTSLAHAPSVFRAMITGKPYPVRAMITLASNPMVTMPNVKLVYKALKSLDLYMVVDYWMTPGAELADYVLPAASFLERPNVFSSNGLASYVQACEAIFPPAYERRNDFDFWRGLGLRLGQEPYWPWKSLEESYDYRLAPMGYTLKEFVSQKGGYETLREKYEKTGFATPTGKVELYSSILEKLGYVTPSRTTRRRLRLLSVPRNCPGNTLSCSSPADAYSPIIIRNIARLTPCASSVPTRWYSSTLRRRRNMA